MKPVVKITNITSSGKYHVTRTINRIRQHFINLIEIIDTKEETDPNVEYKANALKFRLKDDQWDDIITVRLWESGNFSVLGCKNEDQINFACNKLGEFLQRKGYSIEFDHHKLKSVTGLLDFGDKLVRQPTPNQLIKCGVKYIPDLLYMKCSGFNVIFESITCRVFLTGKIMFMCARSFEQIDRIEKYFTDLFSKHHFI